MSAYSPQWWTNIVLHSHASGVHDQKNLWHSRVQDGSLHIGISIGHLTFMQLENIANVNATIIVHVHILQTTIKYFPLKIFYLTSDQVSNTNCLGDVLS